jgi:hypothetical protein
MMMSDLGLTGNRASTLEQKRKIFVLFCFFAFDGKEFVLFGSFYIYICMHNILNV